MTPIVALAMNYRVQRPEHTCATNKSLLDCIAHHFPRESKNKVFLERFATRLLDDRFIVGNVKALSDMFNMKPKEVASCVHVLEEKKLMYRFKTNKRCHHVNLLDWAYLGFKPAPLSAEQHERFEAIDWLDLSQKLSAKKYY